MQAQHCVSPASQFHFQPEHLNVTPKTDNPFLNWKTTEKLC
jgi:hypothetical protein